MVNGTAIRALKDANRIIVNAEGTAFAKAVREQVGRELTSVLAKHGEIEKVFRYGYCDILAGKKPYQKKYNILGIQKRGMESVDKDSFGYSPFCVVSANLGTGKVDVNYSAILFIFPPKDYSKAADVVNRIRSDLKSDDFANFTLEEKNIRIKHRGFSEYEYKLEGFVVRGRLEDVLGSMRKYENKLDDFLKS